MSKSDDPHYRVDPLSGETVIIAPARSARPNAMAPLDSSNVAAGTGDDAEDCPFCRGHESQTPKTLAYYPKTASPDAWQVRVIPNLYPAVVPEPTDAPLPDHAVGQHEVVIEGPDHFRSLTELTEEQLAWTALAYSDRMQAHREAGAVYTQVFKNAGRAAGASLAHTHSQITALHRVPPRLGQELLHCREHAEANNGDCLICDLLEKERSKKERVVIANDDFLVYCPYASRLPFELCIAPTKHQPHFWAQDEAERARFARTLYQTVALLEKMEKRLPFNYLVHTAPFDIMSNQPYHWHLELVPRFARQAGFEWGTGLHLNPVAPEVAAAKLRSL